MGATISYFLIGIAIGTITLVLMATIGRVNKLQKLIDSSSAITEAAINKLEQHDRRIAGLLELIEETAQTLSKVVDKIDMHDQEFVDQQLMINKHDQAFIDQQIMIDHLNQKIIKIGEGE